jgi:hypothetical protein
LNAGLQNYRLIEAVAFERDSDLGVDRAMREHGFCGLRVRRRVPVMLEEEALQVRYWEVPRARAPRWARPNLIRRTQARLLPSAPRLAGTLDGLS